MIKHFVKDELKMHQDISSRKSQVTMTDFEEKTYQVDLTGATISSASSISLLHHYCSKLPHDEYALNALLVMQQHFLFDRESKYEILH